MASVLTMPSAVSIPSFISATKASEIAATKNDDCFGLFNDGELDFDLLADYLLEEANDFDAPLITEQPQNTVTASVTPDVPDADFADPLADATFAINFPSAPQQPVIPKQVTHVPAPAPAAVHNPAPAIVATAPPPTAGMTGPPPTLAGIAQTQAPAPTNTQTMIVHQHKRQRLDNVPTPNNVNVPMQTTSIKPMSHAPPPPRAPVPSTISNPVSLPVAHPGHQSMNIVNNQIIEPRSGRQKSQAQIDRRRERNRILARRTRLRKKFFFESLQKEVMDLQKENMVLKEIVKSRFEEKKAETVLKGCKANQELPQVVLEHCGDPSALARQDFNLIASIKQSQESFVITDPSLQDNPIVYSSDGFLALTGYTREQVLGRNCRFLQGVDTDPSKVAEIRKALQAGDDVSVTFLNYRADGTPFWNKLFIAALRDAQNNIVNYIGVSVKVAGDKESGDLQATDSDGMNEEHNGDLVNGPTVDVDATVMAIEGAVDAAVAAAPNVVKKATTQTS